MDEKKRLKCFDELFSINAPSEMPLEMLAQNPAGRLSKVRHRVMAARSCAGLVVSDAALILRCREQNTETAFSTRGSYLGDPVRFRIDLQEPVKEVWR